MAHVVNTVIECPFELEGTYDIEVDGVTKTLNSGGASTWYRIVFCNGSNMGGETDPLNFTAALQTALGSDYQVRPPTTDGKVALKRTGAGPGAVDFSITSEGEAIAALLGYASTVLNFSSGQTITADYPPAYRLLLIGRGGDTDWQAEPAGSAYTEADNGLVYGEQSNLVKQRRSLALLYHPRDVTVWTTQVGVVGEFPNTPVYPAPSGTYRSRMTDVTEGLPTSKPPLPFTLLDFYAAAKGRRLAAVWGIFQQVLTGAASLVWDECYLDKQTCERGPYVKLPDARWNSLMSPGPWGLVLASDGSGVAP